MKTNKDESESLQNKKHICDGGDDKGNVGCFRCEREMIKHLKSPQTTWKEEFDKKFCDKEGCQANSEECGERADVSGHFFCSTCEKWGGKEGVAKDFKRPVATSKQIKSFIADQIKKAREETKDKQSEYWHTKFEEHTEYHIGLREKAVQQEQDRILTILEDTLEHSSGGGNWRRNLIVAMGKIKE